MLSTGIQKNLHLRSWVSTAPVWGGGHKVSSTACQVDAIDG